MGKNKTVIIGEAGSNHNRNFDQALALIDIAAEAKCDIVKFQTYSAKTLYAENTFQNGVDLRDLISKIEIPRNWQKDLKNYAEERGLEFLSTPFDEEGIDELFNLGVKRIKLGAYEALDPRLVRHAAKTKLPLIFSVVAGGNLDTIEQTLSWIAKENTQPDLTILHCNKSYPTPYRDIRLDQIPKLLKVKASLPFKVGLSDHSLGSEVAGLAVMVGATMIEKHYTISRRLKGPDHSFSLEPEELKQMVEKVRLAEECKGEKTERFTPSELEDTSIGMRSLVATKNLLKGSILTTENISTIRPHPEGAIAAAAYEIIGDGAQFILQKDIKEGDLIFWHQVQGPFPPKT